MAPEHILLHKQITVREWGESLRRLDYDKLQQLHKS